MKLPIVIVFQEIFGVNHHIRSVCDRLALEGFLVVAPELFHRIGRRIEVSYGDKHVAMPLLQTLTNESILQDSRDTLEFLRVLPTADLSNINTLGFCVGGFCSILAATELPLKKAISYYGAGVVRPREGVQLKPILNEFKKIRSECLFIFGEKDSSIPATDRMLIEKKLDEEKIPFEIELYANSDHGFFCDERKSYNREDASVAWKETIKFLKNDTENLRKKDFLLSSQNGTTQRAGDRRQSDQQI